MPSTVTIVFDNILNVIWSFFGTLVQALDSLQRAHDLAEATGNKVCLDAAILE